jgi:hypothetical protein
MFASPTCLQRVFVFLVALSFTAQAEMFHPDSRGTISMVRRTGTSAIETLTASTSLASCKPTGETETKKSADGTLECRKRFLGEQQQQCLLVERFVPTGRGLRWEIEVHGESASWSTAINTSLQWERTEGLTWWTAWGDSDPGAPKGIRSGAENESDWWNDPLVPVPFADATLFYGGRSHDQPQAFSIPVVTILDTKSKCGLSLVLSPEDLIFDMRFDVDGAGTMTFSREHHRISRDHPVTFAMDLVVHEADWRSGVGWMVGRYPEYFDPPNPHVQEMAGCGAYSSHARDFDVERLKRMAFRVNWKASFDFPYMGMFVPPVPDETTEWTDFKKNRTSLRRMREDIRFYTTKGFHVLNYFNVTEFGNYIKYPPPARKAGTDQDMWKDPNDFVYYVLGDAILKDPKRDRPYFSWEGCIAMDPGEPKYQAFLVEQAQRHIDAFPESSGICIDRMDWLRLFNPRFDDEASWVADAPARSLVVSWHEIIEKIGEIMHSNGKVIYCNPHYRRLDLLRHIDGVYDEFGQMGHSMNLCALLALRKPIMAWTIMTPEFKHAPDAYFQRHLHMGAYLTAPLPGNDHTILPSPEVDRFYFDYGPMLKALRGKQWVLEPYAVTVEDDVAKANLFSVPDGYVVPVTFGGDAPAARVALRYLIKRPGQDSFQATVLHPGKTDWAPLPLSASNDAIVLDVPLVRGCAMVRIY